MLLFVNPLPSHYDFRVGSLVTVAREAADDREACFKEEEKEFSEYFEVQILKAYQKPFTRLVEEGTYITSHKGELLNSKSEWHQAKVVRTRTQVVQGGAEVVNHHHGGGGRVGVQGVGRQGQGEGRGRALGGRAADRAQGQ